MQQPNLFSGDSLKIKKGHSLYFIVIVALYTLAPAQEIEYRIKQGDSVEVRLWGCADCDGIYAIDERGIIRRGLPFLDTALRGAGKRVEGLAAELTGQFVKYFKQPRVTVRLVSAAPAQAPSPSPTPTPPSSDIFIIGLTNKGGQMKLDKLVKITNWVGYNNQPSFWSDGESVLYTSIRDKQADIYRYDIRSGSTSQITNTPESEFSPTLMPDGKFVSVVRVEADGTQRLWKFPLSGGSPSLILEKIKSVGYHLWIDDHTLALFILGRPNTLQIVDTRTERVGTIAENPGRILRRIPHQNKFSFVHKISDRDWEIEAFDLDSGNITTIIKTFPGVEDYTWTPSGVLLMAKDSKLFARRKSVWAWQEIADFSNAGLKGITRIAVSPNGNRVALVARGDAR